MVFVEDKYDGLECDVILGSNYYAAAEDHVVGNASGRIDGMKMSLHRILFRER